MEVLPLEALPEALSWADFMAFDLAPGAFSRIEETFRIDAVYPLSRGGPGIGAGAHAVVEIRMRPVRGGAELRSARAAAGNWLAKKGRSLISNELEEG